jgi:hypothetical protein
MSKPIVGLVYMNSRVLEQAMKKVIANKEPMVGELSLVPFPPYRISIQKDKHRSLAEAIINIGMSEREKRLFNGLCLIVGEKYRETLEQACDLLSEEISKYYIHMSKQLIGGNAAFPSVRRTAILAYHEKVTGFISSSENRMLEKISPEIKNLEEHVRTARAAVRTQVKDLTLNVVGIAGTVVVIATTGVGTFGVGSVLGLVGLFKSVAEFGRSVFNLAMDVQSAVLRSAAGLEKLCSMANRKADGTAKPGGVGSRVKTYGLITVHVSMKSLIGWSPGVGFDDESGRIDLAQGKLSGMVITAGFLREQLDDAEKAYKAVMNHKEAISNAMRNASAAAQRRLGTDIDQSNLDHQASILQGKIADIASKFTACATQFEKLAGILDKVKETFKNLKKEEWWLSHYEECLSFFMEVAMNLAEAAVSAAAAHDAVLFATEAAGVAKDMITDKLQEKLEKCAYGKLLGKDSSDGLNNTSLL